MATSKNNESSAKRATGTGARSTMIAKADTTKAKTATVALTVAMMQGNAIKPVQNESIETAKTDHVAKFPPKNKSRYSVNSFDSKKRAAITNVSSASLKTTSAKSPPVNKRTVSNVARMPSTTSTALSKKRKQEDEKTSDGNKIAKISEKSTLNWAEIMKRHVKVETAESPQPEVPLTKEERISTAIDDAENSTDFYKNEGTDEEAKPFITLCDYVVQVSEAREGNDQCSSLPMWNHTKLACREMLHSMQTVNIWLIDFCIATKTELGNSFQYTEMLAVYVGKFHCCICLYRIIDTNRNYYFCIISISNCCE